MVQLSLKKHITSQPEEVFELFTNFADAAENLSAVERVEVLGEGPVGVGTRFRETRVMFKKEATEEMEVTAFDPPRSFTVEATSCGQRFKSLFRFAPNDGGTDVYLDMEARPLTFMAKLMTPVAMLMSGTMKKCMEQDLDDLREVAERTPPDAS